MHKFIGKFFLGIFVVSVFSIGSLTFAATCNDLNTSIDKDIYGTNTWKCADTNGFRCTGTATPEFKSGLCPGGNNIKCSICTKEMGKIDSKQLTTPETTDSDIIAPEEKCVDNAAGGECCGGKPYYSSEKKADVCCHGTLLNTNVPFIGQCISFSKNGTDIADDGTVVVTETTAFPRLMGGLTKMMVTVILLISFIAILAGGVMVAASGGSDTNAKKGKELIGKVIIAIAILGASGVILRLINPNFFK